MPDHWHGLVELGERDNLSIVMNRLKAFTSRSMNGPVWDRGFHDRALRRDENVIAVARYIVANPLRAGLVQNVMDYPYWHCVWL